VTSPAAPDPLSLGGIVLADVTTGEPFDLGAGPPLAVVSVIRHRY